MTNVQNLILETLKKIHTEQAAARDRDGELLLRVGNIESTIARFSRHESQNYGEIVEGRHELDRLKTRVDRIERRLEIAD